MMREGLQRVIVAVIILFTGMGALAADRPALLLNLPQAGTTADLGRDDGLRKVIVIADRFIERSQRQEAQQRLERNQMLARTTFGEMSPAELREYFLEPKHFVSDKDRRGWKQLRELALSALASTTPQSRQACTWQMREIAAAIRNNHRSPSPPYMDVLQPPLYYMDYARNPIAKGQRLAYNLRRDANPDLSTHDPLPSTFWVRPASISGQDLFHGFGRARTPEFETKLWAYAGPKTSYGGCPGFEAQADGTRIKVKFAETTSEPFTARIFSALGYHVEPTDHVQSLRLKYDRRFFREFHLRKDVQMKVRALFVPIHTVNLQQRHDPFDYIHVAVLKDGRRISARELKARLFREPAKEFPEDDPANFLAEFEEQLDLLVTTPANVQTREADVKSIGPWDFQSLDHAERREVRAAGLLGAWVGWFDSRFENTRLKIIQREGTNELRHYFTDLGGGLGQAVGVLSRHCECPNDFGWRFTRPPRPQGKGKMTIPFRIVGYQPIEDTEAFRQMTYDDARWMGRLIAQLSETQIVQALIASGFDATEVTIYTEKLASRRDWMVRDLGLDREYALLRPGGAETAISYDPHTDRIPGVLLDDGTRVSARPSHLSLVDGQISPAIHTRTPAQRIHIPARDHRVHSTHVLCFTEARMTASDPASVILKPL